MDAPWRIEMFGGLRAARGTEEVRRFRSQKVGALLAYLAYYAHRAHPRDTLIEILWPECDPDAGRNRLSVSLSSLRRQLEPPGVPTGGVIVADHAGVRLNPQAVTTDVAQFESALQAASRAGSSTERRERLSEAVELYQGELLPGYFEEWVLTERERLAEAFLEAVGQLVAHLEQVGDLPRAIQGARRMVAADPLREETHQTLIRLLAAAGQPDAALRQYRELERVLDEHLGDTPAPESEALVASLRDGAGTRRANGVVPPAEGWAGARRRVAGCDGARGRVRVYRPVPPSPRLPVSSLSRRAFFPAAR
jgi:DNA-binding SARP family transcriptional activator